MASDGPLLSLSLWARIKAVIPFLFRRRIRFHNDHITNIAYGGKTATARLGAKPAREGDTLVFLTEGGRIFGTATCVSVEHMTAREFVDRSADMPGHRSYSDFGAFVSEFRRYYPDRDVTPETTVWVVRWRDATV